MRTETFRVIEGIMRAIANGWIEDKFDGRIYGELVGPTINGNLHELASHYFVPFDYLKKHCKWNSWSANKYPKTFESIKEWFKDHETMPTFLVSADVGCDTLITIPAIAQDKNGCFYYPPLY